MSNQVTPDQQYPLVVGMLVKYFPVDEKVWYFGIIKGMTQDKEGVKISFKNSANQTMKHVYTLDKVVVKPILSSP